MTDVDPNSHPGQRPFSGLFEMIAVLTHYLELPAHHVDEDVLQQLVESCDDAARYYGDEHCSAPPTWLVTLRGLFEVLRTKARQHRVVSREVH